jgi:pyridoxine 5-phosphate synthase
MIRLGVNVDHVATIRNARGSPYPDPLDAARIALAAGADGITIHLREDRRHIRDDDAQRIRAGISAPLNFEMAVTDEMRAIALGLKPHAICLVPERRQEVTTEGGLDVTGQKQRLRDYVASLKESGARVSLFIDPEPAQLEAAAFAGAAAVELHTGTYAEQVGGATRARELERLKVAAAMARRIDIECHAGHGLTFDNVGPVAAIPDIIELNIGHFLVAEAMFSGLAGAVRTMKQIMLLHRKSIA